MIKDEAQREVILKSFPEIKAEHYDEIEQEVLPHYVFYTSINKKDKECFCTHCRQRYINSPKNRTYTTVIKHNEDGKCIKCGHDITYRSAGRGRKILNASKNVCILRAVGDDLYIRCFTAYQEFYNNEDLPEVNYEEKQRYYLSKEGCQKWGLKWLLVDPENPCSGLRRDWNALKSENEPTFHSPLRNGMSNNSYYVIGEDEIYKTFLKYSQIEIINELSQGWNKYIKYLCFYAKHPNIEYLMKTGFESLISSRLEGRSRYYINWRSNDLKKMLKLSKEEIRLLSGSDESKLIAYKEIKNMAPYLKPSECLSTAKKYCNFIDKIKEINRMSGLSLQQILNYANNQSKNRSERIFFDWHDYLRECHQLGYNTFDSAISKPKNLREAHQRTMQLIEIEKNKADEEKIKKRFEALQYLIYQDEKHIISIPYTIQDIIDEGKILCHCVGSYAKSHADGVCNILFLRKKDALDEPYYTIEIRNFMVYQVRGYKNKAPNNDVKKFMTAYKEYLNNLRLRKVG